MLWHAAACVRFFCGTLGTLTSRKRSRAHDNVVAFIMKTLLSLFRLVQPVQVLGLLAYLVGVALFRISGIKLFQGLCLSFSGISVFLRPDFPSGIRFITEILDEQTYADFCARGGGQVLLDVGANVGLVSLSLCHKHAKLEAHCIEPHPTTYSLLRTNIDANLLSDRVTAYFGGASDRSGPIMIEQSGRSNMAVACERPTATATQVPGWTLDDLCAKNDIEPDLLKIDVEGHELAVLEGATGILGRVQEIVIECHSEQLLMSCREVLDGAGFSVTSKGGLLFGKKGEREGIVT